MQDAAQETFIPAFAALKDLRSPEAFPRRLRKIARNKALAWSREQDRLAPLEDAGGLISTIEATEMEIENERIMADAFQAGVREVVRSISDTLRFPILLCYIEDVPTAAAARFPSISEDAVRKRLHGGKKRLQQRIAKLAEKGTGPSLHAGSELIPSVSVQARETRQDGPIDEIPVAAPE